MSRPATLIAGGGTGGHVFPAIALAERMQEIADVDVVFCGTARGVESRLIPARGWQLELLRVEPLKGRGLLAAVGAAAVAARATTHALAFVRRIRPRAVLSVGGYAAGPAALAAAMCGVPVAVLEPNRVVGLANRLLAPFAKRAYVAWDQAAAAFRSHAARVYGVPLRAGFVPSRPEPRDVSRVLVLGGSQGASFLNERVPEAMALVARDSPAVSVVHQTGLGRDSAVREAYARRGIANVVVAPFLDDMASAIAGADVVVARAGAGTVAEIAAVGRASILVPLPHAADDHQGRNAEALDGRGAAVCVRQEWASPERLARELAHLVSDGEARGKMADRARGLGRPDAARAVALDFLGLAGVPVRGPGAPLGRTAAPPPLGQESR